MTQRDWQVRIDEVQWYHDFDFGNGLRARSYIENVEHVRLIWRFIQEQLDEIDFRGKSVLDVGSWDGYWSFYAERKGASSVVATDDTTQNWAAGQGIHIARELLGSRITIRQDVSIYDVTTLRQQFDIILCLGVFYHLRDPFYGFTQLRHCCHPQSLVVMEGEVGWTGMHDHEVRYLHNPWTEFLPTAAALNGLLKGAYLRTQSQTWMHPFPSAPSEDGPVQSDRSLLVCQPFEGVNDSYLYKPHFGLHVYDDRFRSPDAAAGSPRAWRPRNLRAAIEVRDLPESVAPGEVITATVRVTNTGEGQWMPLPAASLDYERAFLDKRIMSHEYENVEPLARYRDHIESHGLQRMCALGVQLWDQQGVLAIDRDYARGFLAADVEPARSTDVSIRMRAPLSGGVYTLKFDMVQEYVTWFGDAGSDVVLATLNVRSSSR